MVGKVIDMHVHIGGPGDSGSGCRMSPQFIISPAFAFMLIALKASPLQVTDRKIKSIIVNAINNAQKIDNAVLLALDGVYRDSVYIEDESHLVTPNDYVIKIAKANSKILFGASVHPYKNTTIEEMQHCIDNKAVLFKWIPSAQQINPDDPKCDSFYDVLVKHDIPLLCHTGAELAVPTSDFLSNEFNDPKKLKRALAKGVKVIAAHCATPYLGGILPADKDYFQDLMDMLIAADAEGWHLYADISAFCTPTRITYLEKIKNHMSSGDIKPERFIFGSDFPIPVIDITSHKKPLSLGEMQLHLKKKSNAIDDNHSILKNFGIDDKIFTNACNILKLED